MTSPQDIWRAVLGRLQLQVSKPNYETWLKATEGVAFDNERFVVGAPNAFIAPRVSSAAAAFDLKLTMTWYPLRANSRQIALPIPRLPPVISATFFSIFTW